MAKQQQAEANGNIKAVNEAEGPVVVKLAIPADLYEQYQELAGKQGVSPAELMLNRLERCVLHSSIRHLYFSEFQVRQLELILQKRPLDSTELALSTAAAAFKFRIDQFDPISISSIQAKRLHLAAYGGKTAYDHLCLVVQGAIAKATGA